MPKFAQSDASDYTEQSNFAHNVKTFGNRQTGPSQPA